MEVIEIKITDKPEDIADIKKFKKIKKDSIKKREKAWKEMTKAAKKAYIASGHDQVLVDDYEDWLEGNTMYGGLNDDD